jgi:hypothetical protein
MLKLMAKGPDVGDQAADEQGEVGEGIVRFDHRPMSRASCGPSRAAKRTALESQKADPSMVGDRIVSGARDKILMG